MFDQFKDKAMPDAYWLDIQPKNITVDKQNLTNKRTRHCQKPVSWAPCCTVFFDILGRNGPKPGDPKLSSFE